MENYNYKMIGCDTDSIIVNKADGSEWSDQERTKYLNDLNNQFPDKINFDDDGYYESILIIKSKNYALLEKGKDKIKLKGSSIRDQKKEPALKEMLVKIIEAYIYDKSHLVPEIYESYVKEVLNITDISRWAQKKGVTEAITNCEGYELVIEKVVNPQGKFTDKKVYYKKGKPTDIRTNEIVVWDAIKDEEIIQQGDKFYLYPAILSFEDVTTTKTLKSGKEKSTTKRTYTYGLQQIKKWDAVVPNHDKEQLLKRTYDTLCIFDTILDMEQFKNYSLQKNYKLLIGETNEEDKEG